MCLLEAAFSGEEDDRVVVLDAPVEPDPGVVLRLPALPTSRTEPSLPCSLSVDHSDTLISRVLGSLWWRSFRIRCR